VIGTLAVDWWTVTFGTARRGMGGLRPRPDMAPLILFCGFNVAVKGLLAMWLHLAIGRGPRFDVLAPLSLLFISI